MHLQRKTLPEQQMHDTSPSEPVFHDIYLYIYNIIVYSNFSISHFQTFHLDFRLICAEISETKLNINLERI